MIGQAASGPGPWVGSDVVCIPFSLHDGLVNAIRQRHPRKSYGYLLSHGPSGPPTDFVLFDSNIRNEPGWKEQFEAYGSYFVQHPDAGFVASPEEAWRRQKEIWAREMVEVAVLHSHQRHPGNFSRIDFDLHAARFPALWHLIVSMRNPAKPQLRGFAIAGSRVRELEIRIDGQPLPGERLLRRPANREATIASARELLELDRSGRPRSLAGFGFGAAGAARAILLAIGSMTALGSDAFHDLVLDGFLQGRDRRYEEHVATTMQRIGRTQCSIGTESAGRRHFCGEAPAHVVELEPHAISRFPVTNELYGCLDAARLEVPVADRTVPVVGVSWFEATLFAMWMGCRLPTEAEWEHGCGGGSAGEWCCDDESDLPRFAWYSENSAGVARPVGTREPNSLGLFDLHGNVWEWCRDSYDQDAYPWHAPQPPAEPAYRGMGDVRSLRHRACRGGSYHSLSEMCRTRFRCHEPPSFSTRDLGFRLARSSAPNSIWSDERG